MGPLQVNEDSTAGRGILNERVRIPERVVFRRFVRETVVLNIATGKYHGLNPIAGRMLETLQEVGHVGDSAKRLAVEFNVPLSEVQADLSDFCRDLINRGLIEISSK